VDGQLGNFNHSQAKKGPRRIFMPGLLRFELQTKCSGCKMSVLCLLGTVPFDGDDDIVGTVSILQNFAAVIVKFAHLLFFSRKFFEIVLIPILSDVAEVTAHKGGSGMAS
jgi:hypothetical protein